MLSALYYFQEKESGKDKVLFFNAEAENWIGEKGKAKLRDPDHEKIIKFN